MHLSKFLKRINYLAPADVSYASLKALQTAFIFNVPFENSYLLQGKKLQYRTEDAYQKIVNLHHGGLCFENNNLFYWALKEIGFDVIRIAAEMFPGETLSDRLHHMALIVTLDNKRFLVDVGNGKYLGDPIAIDEHAISHAEGTQYKITRLDEKNLALLEMKHGESQWTTRYAFEPIEKSIDDFTDAVSFIESHPESPFNKGILATIFDGAIRKTLSAEHLTFTKGLSETKRPIQAEDIAKILKTEFALPANYEDNSQIKQASQG